MLKVKIVFIGVACLLSACASRRGALSSVSTFASRSEGVTVRSDTGYLVTIRFTDTTLHPIDLASQSRPPVLTPSLADVTIQYRSAGTTIAQTITNADTIANERLAVRQTVPLSGSITPSMWPSVIISVIGILMLAFLFRILSATLPSK